MENQRTNYLFPQTQGEKKLRPFPSHLNQIDTVFFLFRRLSEASLPISS